tara:strand:+ start:273 stop:632 length:360 start_codon:yes stop_codon:yes gene_type:complete
MVNEGKTPFQILVDKLGGDIARKTVLATRAKLYENVKEAINKQEGEEIINELMGNLDYYVSKYNEVLRDGYSDDDIYAKKFYNNKPGGKRKSRRNRKSKKGKKSRKARKSRRKSNRRRR